MSQFLYFVPDVTTASLTPKQFDAIGLGHIHDGQQPDCTLCVGPDKRRGLLVTYARNGLPKDQKVKFAYLPDRQTWIPIRGNDAKDEDPPVFYVGMENDRPPRPATLARAHVYGGETLTFGEHEWEIPWAYPFFKDIQLPMRMKVGKSGKLEQHVEDRYRRVCEIATDAFDRLQKASQTKEVPTWSYGDLWEASIVALGVNYRVGAGEISLLGGLNGEEMIEIIFSICEYRAYQRSVAELEKNEAASASPGTDSGAEANSPATNPPSATSA